MSVGVILVAAGQGVRLGSARPKALVHLGDKPIVQHALGQVFDCPEVAEVVVVVPAGHGSEFAELFAALPPSDVPVRVVDGGGQRSDSVAYGLAALSDGVDSVLVHDAARALAPVAVFDRVIALLRAGHEAVVPVLPVTDTIKQVRDVRPDGLAEVVRTVDRSSLRAVQTPQGFRREVLERAHEDAGERVTDDAGLVEQRGGTVLTVPGDVRSTKITTPHDLAAATQWLPPPAPAPVLVLLGGPPGSGKTSIARALARHRGAAHVRVDTIEQAFLRARDGAGPVGPEGYAAAQSVCADLLAAGLDVVADATNRYVVLRQAWLAAARSTGARCLQVELACSDVSEHRRRVEGRVADIPGHRLPDWASVLEAHWEPWPEADLRLDSGTLSVGEAVAVIEERLA